MLTRAWLPQAAVTDDQSREGSFGCCEIRSILGPKTNVTTARKVAVQGPCAHACTALLCMPYVKPLAVSVNLKFGRSKLGAQCIHCCTALRSVEDGLRTSDLTQKSRVELLQPVELPVAEGFTSLLPGAPKRKAVHSLLQTRTQVCCVALLGSTASSHIGHIGDHQ